MAIIPDFRPSVRYTNGLTIYFKSKQVIQVQHEGIAVNFMNWFNPRGVGYSDSWKPFRERLVRKNDITSLYQVVAIANHYGVDSYRPYFGPDEIPKNIMVRDSYFVEKRKTRRIYESKKKKK